MKIFLFFILSFLLISCGSKKQASPTKGDDKDSSEQTTQADTQEIQDYDEQTGELSVYNVADFKVIQKAKKDYVFFNQSEETIFVSEVGKKKNILKETLGENGCAHILLNIEKVTLHHQRGWGIFDGLVADKEIGTLDLSTGNYYIVDYNKDTDEFFIIPESKKPAQCPVVVKEEAPVVKKEEPKKITQPVVIPDKPGHSAYVFRNASSNPVAVSKDGGRPLYGIAQSGGKCTRIQIPNDVKKVVLLKDAKTVLQEDFDLTTNNQFVIFNSNSAELFRMRSSSDPNPTCANTPQNLPAR